MADDTPTRTDVQARAAERKDALMRSLETIPVEVYCGLAMGSVVFSVLLYLLGRRSTALFVGQWPPTFLALAALFRQSGGRAARSTGGGAD